MSPRPGADIGRRVLLGLVTALIVARPLVLGEDPGLTATGLSDTSGLWLTLLWFLGAVGWAGWRVWSRRGAWFGSLVEAGLLAVVGFAFLSTFKAAAYKRPAFLISWEWLALLAAFCLVRQLARTAEDNRRLLAALLASGVSLSAYAVYQYAVELPALQREFAADRDEFFAKRGLHFEPGDPHLAAWAKRIQDKNVFATYAHPNNFAGYLALLLPAAFAGAVLSFRRDGLAAKTVLVAGCFLLTAAGLLLTFSRGAILGVLVIGVAVLLSRVTARRRVVLGLALCLFAVGLFLGFTPWGNRGLELARQSAAKRLEYWKATWAMITDGKQPAHFWLGVGPGNFGRYYPRYMDPAAGEKVIDPHNFALETWATSGVFSLLALLATLAAFFWLTRNVWKSPPPAPDEGSALETGPAPTGIRWEFYLGGSIGLFFGFLISGMMSPDAYQATQLDLLSKVLYWLAHEKHQLMRVVFCSLLWFPTFALLEDIPWNRRALTLALTAGVTALFLNLCVSGGISYPSVALALWISVALALNSLPARPATWTARHWLGLAIPAPILGSLAFLFVILIFYPVTSGFSYLHNYDLRKAESDWVSKFDPAWRELLVIPERSVKEKEALEEKRRKVTQYNLLLLTRMILPELKKAHEADPADVAPLLELAFWEGEMWKLRPNVAVRQDAIGKAHQAAALDPESLEGYLTQYRLNLLFAHFSDPDKRGGEDVRKFYQFAAASLAQAIKRDPTEARWHFLRAEALSQAGEVLEARQEAAKAQELDHVATDASRKLTEAQREQIRKWLVAGS